LLNNTNAVIFGFESLSLNEAEKQFFARIKPAGFILFKRNIDSPKQVKALVASLKALVGWNCPILIDQEGGRVARLRPPHWPDFPAMKKFADMAQNDLEQAQKATFDNAALLGKTLMELGVNVNCAPVCDLLFEGAHDIVGDRSFGGDVEVVSALARQTAEGLLSEKVLPIIKHIPGHGRAFSDSHEELPVVGASISDLQKADFKVFQNLKDLPWAMTAHILYTAIDDQQPATLSKKVIDYIRNDIGFGGVLISDDLSMKALKGSFAGRTSAALDAGCDVILHCNGDMLEMEAVSEAIAPFSSESGERFKASLAIWS
jgi:beta-N-acetylhexosaminidase